MINASPDSLHTESICVDGATALARGELLLAQGADHLDIGGQGTTSIATRVTEEEEWNRLESVLAAVSVLGVQVSIDSWRPAVVRRALAAGATLINAADGVQGDEMLEMAAEFECPIVVPYLNGPDPLSLSLPRGDPVPPMLDWFEATFRRLRRYGVAGRALVDPGTGFAPAHWEWSERYVFQKRVYENLHLLRRFGRPLYIALPWRETPQHEELEDIVLRYGVEYGRCHHPDRVRSHEAQLART